MTSLAEPDWLDYIQNGQNDSSFCVSPARRGAHGLLCLSPAGRASPPETRTVVGCRREPAGRWWETPSKWPAGNHGNILPCHTEKQDLQNLIFALGPTGCFQSAGPLEKKEVHFNVQR